jgi:low affinity Fe/Cu permease
MFSQREKNVARVHGSFYVLLLAVIAIVAGIVIWHPMGRLRSLIAAAVVYVIGVLAVVKLTRLLMGPIFEEDAIALHDRILGLNKEPPKNWFIWPF